MILFHYVIEILTLPQANTPRKHSFGFQPRYGGRICRVLVDVHDPRRRIPACRQSLSQEPFGGCGISFGREQKVDRLAQ